MIVVVWMLLGPAWSSAEVPADSPPSPAPPFEQVCFDDFDLEHNTLSPDGMRKLLHRAPGRGCWFYEARSGGGTVGCFSGTCRLDVKWQDDSVLRLRLARVRDLDIHFFKGEQGITLRHFVRKQRGWAAYSTTRLGKQAWPESYALWAVDAGRHVRTLDGTLEIRCQDGYLVFSRGDLVMLCVPFDGPPEEVYFDGEAAVHGLAMLRSRPAPLPDTAYDPVSVARVARPADHPWTTELPDGAELKRLPDGRIELTAEVAEYRRDKPVGREALATAVLPTDGLVEYIVEIEDASESTGIFLADRAGRPWLQLLFAVDDDEGRLMFGCRPAASVRRIMSSIYSPPPMPYAGRRQWLRIVAGAGVVRHFVSGDGVHWSPACLDALPIAGEPARIGLCCLGMPTSRSIKLRSVEVRRLDAVESLVPEGVLRRVRLPERLRGTEAWDRWADESRPADVPAELWRRACTIRTLGSGLPAEFCQPLLHELLDKRLAEPGTPEEKLRLLHQASLLMPFDSRTDSWPQLAARYEQLGDALIRGGHPAPFRTIHTAMLRLPVWTWHLPLPRRLFWHELLLAAHDRRGDDLAASTRRLNYWLAPSHQVPTYQWRTWRDERADLLHLLDWSTAEAALRRPGTDDDAESRHPVIEPTNKEGFNALAEFRTAVDAGALREACQVIISSTERHWRSLLPAGDDRRLLQSMPTIVEAAMQKDPSLGEAMRQHFEPLARLRLQQAVVEADPAAVHAITRQFPGTETATAAEGLQADRDLSQGRFVEAAGRYRHALSNALPEQRPELLPRLRLAAAMLGRDVGPVAEDDVAIGAVQLSADRFEQIARHARDAARNETAVASTSETFPPGGYRLEAWAQLETGKPVKHDKTLGTIDYDARSLCVTIAHRRMFVGHALKLAAFDLDSGEMLWQATHPTAPPPAQMLDAMRPVVDGGRVYARRPMQQGTELAAFDAATGRLLFSNTRAGSLVGDPLPVDGRLLAMTTRTNLQWQTTLELTEFDPDSGELIRQTPLASFRDVFGGALSCQMVLAGDEIVATVGGAVVCCDLSGDVRWIRRQPLVPPPEFAPAATRWNRQIHRRPLATDGKIYATQPGVWAVECIDQHTGRLVFSRGLPELTCLVGCTGGNLIVETDTELLALDLGSGEPLWRHAVDRPLDGHAQLAADRLVLVQLESPPVGNAPPRPTLTWIDPQSGETVMRATLTSSDLLRPRPGPLVLHGNRRWLFLGSKSDRKTWPIFELVTVP